MSTIDSGLPIPADEPEEDDVTAELEELALRRRRRFPRVTLALAVAVVGAGAFIGGAEAQKHLGSKPTTSGGGAAGSSFASRFRGGGTGTRGASGTGAASSFLGGGATIGTVAAIKGSTLYVTDTSGATVKVTTSPASQVTKTVTGTVKSVDPGDTVVVRGTTKKNGDIAATSIAIGGAGAGGFGGFGGGGGTGSTGSGSGANGGATGFGFNGSTTKGGG
jgi:hypothetical protein